MPLIAEIAVSGTSYSFDMLFSYRIPENMEISEGCRVLVPFGRGNKRKTGVIMHISEGNISRLKSIVAQIDNSPLLSTEQLRIAEYLHEHTFCTYFEAIKAMLPPAMNVKTKEYFRLSRKIHENTEISKSAEELSETLKMIDDDVLINEYVDNYISRNGRLFVDELLDAEILKSSNDFIQRTGDVFAKKIKLSEKYIDNPDSFSLTPKQKKVAEFLKEYGSVAFHEAAYMCGVTDSVVKRLVKSGAAEEYKEEILRTVGKNPEEYIDINSVVLSEKQQKAYDVIFSEITEKKSSVFLLHGVTGSGKTSVFEKLIDSTVKTGRKIMMLIPEISLTPQILNRFRSLFGERIAVIHSGLTLGQRFDEYKRIKRGDVDIVIGTRSAIFAPLENIGLIILDEEGERTYKSEQVPRYSTHDIARQRGAYNNSVVIFASATPSVESYYLAEKGVYRLIEIDERYGNAVLPEVSIVDMIEERENGNYSEYSEKLIDELEKNLANGEQSILLLNRRGFHTIMMCSKCRKAMYCPNCSVTLTHHKKNNRLMCHYCGYSIDVPEKCPECNSERIRSIGFGTQKLEEQLKLLFPSARILRMDADTVFSRDSYEKNFEAFRNGEYDIMIGTQMIGKGLDFPAVTLVGVLSVDVSLYSGDFRSYEKTFSLITQVVGRSGRGENKGRAVLQTSIPEHYIMQLASQQNYKAFYNEEIALRRAMIFPPVCDMFVFCISGEDEQEVITGADSVLRLMDIKLKELQPESPVRVLGHTQARHRILNGRYRRMIIVKSKNNAEMRGFISNILKESVKLKEMKKITISVNVNGDTGV